MGEDGKRKGTECRDGLQKGQPGKGPWWEQRLAAGMSVEAALVVSVILMVMLWIMSAAITLYQETAQTATIDWVSIEGLATGFRSRNLVETLIEELIP